MNSYYQVLSAAVEDVLSKGYCGPTQIGLWQQRLKDSIEETFKGDSSVTLARTLSNAFERLIVRRGIARFHVGLSASTFGRLEPVLRNELVDRLLGAQALLRLREEEATLSSLRKFSGWAMTIPRGGAKPFERALKKAEIKKPLASLPFESGRAIAAQGEALQVAFNEIISREGKALCAEWHSRWRQPGYAYRDDHKDRDLKFFAFKDSWAAKQGLLVPLPSVDSVTFPGQERGCRCFHRYFYTLESLPREVLSSRGLLALAA